MTGSRLFEEEQSPRRDRDNSPQLYYLTRPVVDWYGGNTNLDIIGWLEGGGGAVSRKL